MSPWLTLATFCSVFFKLNWFLTGSHKNNFLRARHFLGILHLFFKTLRSPKRLLCMLGSLYFTLNCLKYSFNLVDTCPSVFQKCVWPIRGTYPWLEADLNYTEDYRCGWTINSIDGVPSGGSWQQLSRQSTGVQTDGQFSLKENSLKRISRKAYLQRYAVRYPVVHSTTYCDSK